MHCQINVGSLWNIFQVILYPFDLLFVYTFLIVLVPFVKDVVQNDILIIASVESIVCRAKEIFIYV